MTVLLLSFVTVFSHLFGSFGAPTPIPSESCANTCSYDSSKPCQCNSECLDYNDCCDDWTTYCASCKEMGCGDYDPSRECQCNSQCGQYGNCCDDYEDYCQDHNVTECFKAPSNTSDRRSNKKRLRIMEYNVDWLFTSYIHSQGSIVCPGDCEWNTTTRATKHQSTVATYITSIDPDILFLEEVSDCWELHQLINSMPNIDGLPASQIYKPYLILGTDTYTGENVGLITKIDPIVDLQRSNEYVEYPIPGNTCGYDGSSGEQGCSKHFYTELNIENLNKPLSLIGVHFLSSPTSSTNCVKREAQATVIEGIIESAYNKNNYIIVAGDFNDYADDVADCNNDIPTSRVTKIIRTAGNLYNVASKILDQSQIYSDWYDKDNSCKDEGGDEHSLIDQVYISEGLYNKLDDVYIDHSYTAGCSCLYSDHWPVVFEFDLSKFVIDEDSDQDKNEV